MTNETREIQKEEWRRKHYPTAEEIVKDVEKEWEEKGGRTFNDFLGEN